MKISKFFQQVLFFSPDEICDTYLGIDGNLQLKVNIYNALMAKAHA